MRGILALICVTGAALVGGGFRVKVTVNNTTDAEVDLTGTPVLINGGMTKFQVATVGDFIIPAHTSKSISMDAQVAAPPSGTYNVQILGFFDGSDILIKDPTP